MQGGGTIETRRREAAQHTVSVPMVKGRLREDEEIDGGLQSHKYCSPGLHPYRLNARGRGPCYNSGAERALRGYWVPTHAGQERPRAIRYKRLPSLLA